MDVPRMDEYCGRPPTSGMSLYMFMPGGSAEATIIMRDVAIREE